MKTNSPYTADGFRDRALNQHGKAVEAAWREHGDHLLNPDVVLWAEGQTLRDAAVLVPILDRGVEDARVLLTLRTTRLRKHSGQIAFPGGAIDEADATAEAAALREAYEETGLAAEFVEPVGRLPHYLAASGFKITPVLAVVWPGFTLRPNPDEVADIFEVPLSFLMDPRNHETGSKTWNGSLRHFYRMPYEDRMIWGVTAGILRTLYERLYA